MYVAGVKFVGFIKPWQRKEGVKRKTVAAEALREKPVVNMLTHKTWMMILIPVCYFFLSSLSYVFWVMGFVGVFFFFRVTGFNVAVDSFIEFNLCWRKKGLNIHLF